MRKLIILFFCFIAFYKVKAQNAADTIYVRGFNEDLASKFLSVNNNELKINFFFKVDWNLHYKRNTILFEYISGNGAAGKVWTLPSNNKKEFLSAKYLYTIKEFTDKLEDSSFRNGTLRNKILILLYAPRCYDILEMYTVKLGSDLSKEG